MVVGLLEGLLGQEKTGGILRREDAYKGVHVVLAVSSGRIHVFSSDSNEAMRAEWHRSTVEVVHVWVAWAILFCSRDCISTRDVVLESSLDMYHYQAVVDARDPSVFVLEFALIPSAFS